MIFTDLLSVLTHDAGQNIRDRYPHNFSYGFGFFLRAGEVYYDHVN
jgi:hypothetical protein